MTTITPDTEPTLGHTLDTVQDRFLAEALREALGPQGGKISNDELADFVVQRGGALQDAHLERKLRKKAGDLKWEELDPVATRDKDDQRSGYDLHHPAFATITASRISGGDNNLFASKVHNHYGTVRIAITGAHLHRDGYAEYVHSSRGEMIEVELSEAQWVAFISRPNFGSGTPCTLRHFAGEFTPRIKRQPTVIEQVEQQIEDMLTGNDERHEAALVKLRNTLADRLPKKVLDEVMKALSGLGHINANTRKFQRERLQAARDQLMTESRIELESLALSTAHSFGLESIQQLGQILAADPSKALKLLAAPDIDA